MVARPSIPCPGVPTLCSDPDGKPRDLGREFCAPLLLAFCPHSASPSHLPLLLTGPLHVLFPTPTALLLTPYPPRVLAQIPARPRSTRQTGPGPSVLHPPFCLCGISQNTHYWSRCLIPFSSEGGGRVCLVPTKPQHLGHNLEVPEGVRDSTVSHRNEPDHLPHGSGEREGPSSSGHRRVLVLGLRSSAGGGGGAFGRTPHQRGAAGASARGHVASLFPLSRRHHQPLEKPR